MPVAADRYRAGRLFPFSGAGRLPPRSDKGLGASATRFCRLTILGGRCNAPIRDDPGPHFGCAQRHPTRSTPLTTIVAVSPATNTLIADLVLVRMILVSKKPVAPSVVRRDVGNLLDSELSAAEFDHLRSDLASAGYLTK